MELYGPPLQRDRLIFSENNNDLAYIVCWWNYNIGPSSLPCVHNWSLKFEACAISPSSFQNEQYKSFY